MAFQLLQKKKKKDIMNSRIICELFWSNLLIL